MSDLFQEIKVWHRKGDGLAIRYGCFRDLASGKFAVQSADFFRLPLDAILVRQLDAQFMELFMDASPLDRCDWFDSLELAIEAHDREFSNE